MHQHASLAANYGLRWKFMKWAITLEIRNGFGSVVYSARLRSRLRCHPCAAAESPHRSSMPLKAGTCEGVDPQRTRTHRPHSTRPSRRCFSDVHPAFCTCYWDCRRSLLQSLELLSNQGPVPSTGSPAERASSAPMCPCRSTITMPVTLAR